MEVVINDNIADINRRPSQVSLANSPNFIELGSKKDGEVIDRFKFIVSVNDGEYAEVKITIKDNVSLQDYDFTSTQNVAKVGNSVFYYHPEDAKITAENIKNCLNKNIYIKGNFDMLIPIDRANKIEITPKPLATMLDTSLRLSPDNTCVELQTQKIETSQLADSIKQGMMATHNTQIELEIYKNTGVALGSDNTASMGTLVTSLSKMYFNQPIWFDVNSVWRNNYVYSPRCIVDNVEGSKWCDAGTLTDFRFTVKRKDGIINQTFYVSDILYILSGYNRSLDGNDLNDYVYNMRQMDTIQPLTTQGIATHIKGQSQYFNFILANTVKVSDSDTFGLQYRLMYQTGHSLPNGVTLLHSQGHSQFDTVNTIKLDLDGVIAAHDHSERVASVEVRLMHNDREVSRPMTFRIMPQWMYPVHDFAFLNSLGGWSSFNFAGKEQFDFQVSSEAIYKTQTPQHTIASEIESVWNKQVEEQFVVESLPMQAAEAEWLTELSASVAVYEIATQRYVIVDELSVKTNNSDDLFTLQMKYHYSDTWNGNLRG